MSATFTVPPGPPLNGSIPKSVCFRTNVPTARIESGAMVTSAVHRHPARGAGHRHQEGERHLPAPRVQRLRGEAHLGIAVHVQHVGAHRLGDFPDLFRVGRREHLEAVGRQGEVQRRGRPSRAIDQLAPDAVGLDHVGVTGEAEESGLAGFHHQPAAGIHRVHGGIGGGGGRLRRARVLGQRPEQSKRQEAGRQT